ncbi:MAG TPA: hypothetical protein VGB85_02205 [Nannocystis sp.]|jgi:hypothetical protein
MYLDANFRSLRVSGTTSEGVPVIAGLFPVVNSEGVALDMLLELFHDRRWSVDWFDFLVHARDFGWNLRTTLGKIHTALEAVEGPAFAGAWLRSAEAMVPTLLRVRVVSA